MWTGITIIITIYVKNNGNTKGKDMLVHCKINESAFKKFPDVQLFCLNFLAKIFWPFLKEKKSQINNDKLPRGRFSWKWTHNSSIFIALHWQFNRGTPGTETHTIYAVWAHLVLSYQITQIQVKLGKPSCLWVSGIKTF